MKLEREILLGGLIATFIGIVRFIVVNIGAVGELFAIYFRVICIGWGGKLGFI